MYKNDNSVFLLLAISCFVIFDSDNSFNLCPLGKSKTHWNIFMIFGRNEEQDQTTCHVQKCLSYFLFCKTVIIH